MAPFDHRAQVNHERLIDRAVIQLAAVNLLDNRLKIRWGAIPI